jgi:sulfatase maturation enzyme AslB (radical SAM superfamily)
VQLKFVVDKTPSIFLMSLKMNETFCILPWMSMSTNPKGELRVCCNSTDSLTPGAPSNLITRDDNTPYHILDNDIDNFWNSKILKNLRNDFLNNRKPRMCHQCFNLESLDIESPRQIKNKKWMFDYEPSITPPVIIKYIDIRLGNLCNLKCRMCNPYSSNQWIEEWGLIREPLNDKTKTQLFKMDWPNDDKVSENLLKFANTIEEIYLTGGEPTLATSQYTLFDKLIELGVAKNITLKYNTNCTNLPKKMIDYWQHFKKISLNASIDAYGDLNRYIRYPTGWSLVETNLMKFKELSHENLILQIHITVQMYNILHLDKLLEFLDMYKMNNIHLGILDHPSCLNIKVLPTELKELARDRLKPFMHIPAVRGVVDYMLAADLSSRLNEFKIYTLALDKSRNESILELVPEMKDIFNNDI